MCWPRSDVQEAFTLCKGEHVCRIGVSVYQLSLPPAPVPLLRYLITFFSLRMQMRDIALALDNEFITTRDCFEFKVCSCSTADPSLLAAYSCWHSSLWRPAVGLVMPDQWVALPLSLIKSSAEAISSPFPRLTASS